MSWAAFDTADKTFSIPIVNDTTVEGNETVLLIIRNPTGAAVLGRASATLLIDDDEPSGGYMVYLPMIAN